MKPVKYHEQFYSDTWLHRFKRGDEIVIWQFDYPQAGTELHVRGGLLPNPTSPNTFLVAYFRVKKKSIINPEN